MGVGVRPSGAMIKKGKGLAGAWKLWRKAKRNMAAGAKKAKAKIKGAVSRAKSKVKKKKSGSTSVQKRATKTKNKKGGSRMPKQIVFFKDPMINTVAKTGVTVAIGVASTMAMENIPWVKDQGTGTKVATQGVTAVALLWFGRKMPAVQLVAVGILTGAAFTLAMPIFNWMKRGFKGKIFSGPGALTPYQKKKLAYRVSGPRDTMLNGPRDTMLNGPGDVLYDNSGMRGPWPQGSNMGNTRHAMTVAGHRAFVGVN